MTEKEENVEYGAYRVTKKRRRPVCNTFFDSFEPGGRGRAFGRFDAAIVDAIIQNHVKFFLFGALPTRAWTPPHLKTIGKFKEYING